eukprot:9479192-Pyramimonas_sp.AAC.2
MPTSKSHMPISVPMSVVLLTKLSRKFLGLGPGNGMNLTRGSARGSWARAPRGPQGGQGRLGNWEPAGAWAWGLASSLGAMGHGALVGLSRARAWGLAWGPQALGPGALGGPLY